jgi:hypothetical protein
MESYVLAWSTRDDVILDPFSGWGTTVLESPLNGRALGCDTNPVAVCLSKAKADPPAVQAILERLDTLETQPLRFTPNSTGATTARTASSTHSRSAACTERAPGQNSASATGCRAPSAQAGLLGQVVA